MEKEQVMSQPLAGIDSTPVEEFLKVLYEHKKSWEKDGKYQEAQDAVKRIQQLRDQETKRKKLELQGKLKSDEQMCESAHQKEIQEFLHRWEKIIIPEFENERLLIELETKKRHQNEIEELKEKSKTDNSLKFRHSPELLNIQKQIESLASLGKYNQAKKMKSKFKKLEKIEKSKHLKVVK